ncbi:MAG TPA: hypothetical protein VNA20_10580 [Frankiaceae bacterium]|nr:hypothetical protein [Frankiaceae bacterium]
MASTRSADADRVLALTPPYGLRDADGRADALADLTALVVGLDAPGQVWHGPARCDVTVTGAGAAAELTRRLAETARPRETVLAATASEDEPVEVVAERRDHVVLADGSLARVFALTGWPSSVTPGWLDDVAVGCAVVVLHLVPVAREDALRVLRRRLAALTSTAYLDEQSGRLADPVAAVAAETAEGLRDALAHGTTRLFQTQVLFAVTAPDVDELDARTRVLHAELAAILAEAKPLTWQHAVGWRAVQRGGSAMRWPWRLLDATTVAATIPHPVGPAAGVRGVLVGIEPESGVPLLVDRFGEHNPTRLVVGTSGAGKSYAAKLELIRQRVAGASAVVVDPEGEFGHVADVLGGLTLAVGEEPAGLDPVGLATRRGLAAAEGLSVLASWAAALLGGSLSAIDLALLDRALDVLRSDATAAATAGDLLGVVADLSAHPPFQGADLAARLAPAAAGTLASLFAPNPDLADPPPLVVFDLRAVPARVRPAVMACVLAWAWCETVGASVVSPRLVVVDEAHLLLDDPPAAELLAQFARRARKYGVGLEVVTQRLSDFLRHPAGEAVLANAATKLLLGCEDHERAAITAGLGLTEPEADELRPGRRGSGLLLTPTVRTRIEIVSAEVEHALAGAGPRTR